MDVEQPSGDSEVEVSTSPEPDIRQPTVEPSEDTTDAELVDDQQPEPDEVEDELDGVKLRGPKETLERLKAERLMQADYTRKTQEVAEQRKQFEFERQQFNQHQQNFQQHQREVAALVNIDQRLAALQSVNVNALIDTEPLQALKLQNELTQLQATRAQIVGTLTQRQQQAEFERQQTTAKELAEAQQVVEREIKGWSPELKNKLFSYGQSNGFPPEVLGNVTKPAFVKMLHKAYLFDQLQAQRTAKPSAAPAPPVSRVGGAHAPSTKDPSAMTDAEFAAFRRRQIAQRR